MAQDEWKSWEVDWEVSSGSTQVNSSICQLSCACYIPGYPAEGLWLEWSNTDCGAVYEKILRMQMFESTRKSSLNLTGFYL